jgi:hypothetical protein
MTIDEKLDRLTDRVDAIAQSVELIAHAQIKNDKRMGQLMETMNRLEDRAQ